MVLLVLAAVVELMPGALFTEWGILVAAFWLGLSAQGVKICVDTLVQLGVDDEFRGRVFSLYDVIFNVVFVAAAAVGALVIPTNGKSYALFVCISIGYAATALVYAATNRRTQLAAVRCSRGSATGCVAGRPTRRAGPRGPGPRRSGPGRAGAPAGSGRPPRRPDRAGCPAPP